LLFAFGMLGSGYFLTARAGQYGTVFLALVVVGLGAGTFKPIVSGCIARCTDETNGTVGFGIYYWSINLGAFLVPLILVPYLKNNLGCSFVILASAIGTGMMVVPTLLFFREPPAPKQKEEERGPRPGLMQTLANALEIIYSPFVLLGQLGHGGWPLWVILGGLLGGGAYQFTRVPEHQVSLATPGVRLGGVTLTARLKRHLGKPEGYQLERLADGPGQRRWVRVVLHDPDRLERFACKLRSQLETFGASGVSLEVLRKVRDQLALRVNLTAVLEAGLRDPWVLVNDGREVRLRLRDLRAYRSNRGVLLEELRLIPGLGGLLAGELDEVVGKTGERSFLLLFLGLLLGASLLVLRLQRTFQTAKAGLRALLVLGTVAVWGALLWLLPSLSLFARVLGTVVGSTVVALYAIDTGEVARFRDHFRLLLMIFIYSGFWVLYFQMFDSVLWYVQAYVDASSLDSAVNAALGALGVRARWHFDVEHVTVINAGTIILLQLVISNLVKRTRALPTMVVGIGFGTLGMAVLAISTGIWVFILGITIFSIGEMTAHPKFIAYVGQTAPRARVAMYMGYVFLYGVVGSSIGGVVGANLYVRFVDELNRPRTLWLIFAGIGVLTMLGLLLYDRFVVRDRPARAASE
jgi:dipeptide/tripeptide permease